MTHASIRGLRCRSLTAIAALAGVLVCAAAPAAFAQSLSDETVRISTVNLDLSSQGGVQQLLHRIRLAAVKVCAHQGDDPLSTTGGYFGCVRRTKADAVARVDNPRLTALYRGGAGAVGLASNR